MKYTKSGSDEEYSFLEEKTRMKRMIIGFRLMIVAISLAAAGAIETLHAAAAQSTAEQLYAELAKLKPEQRTKKLEEGGRKEGKLNFVHTWRGKLARDFGSAFEKRH